LHTFIYGLDAQMLAFIVTRYPQHFSGVVFDLGLADSGGLIESEEICLPYA